MLNNIFNGILEDNIKASNTKLVRKKPPLQNVCRSAHTYLGKGLLFI